MNDRLIWQVAEIVRVNGTGCQERAGADQLRTSRRDAGRWVAQAFMVGDLPAYGIEED
jgi:hypothetical protein